MVALPMHDVALASGTTPASLEQDLRPLTAALDDDPTDASALRALFDLYQRSSLTDRACCVAEALMALHKASPGQTLWRGQHRPRALPAARRPLGPEMLRDHVAHPDQDRHLTAICSIIAPAVATWRATSPPNTLRPDERVDVGSEPSDAARMVMYAQRILEVGIPDLYLRPRDRGDHAVLNLRRDGVLRPTLVLFDRLLDRRKEPELGYGIGRAMADMLRPHYTFVALDHSATNLRYVIAACLHRAGHPTTGNGAALDAIADEIFARLDPAARDELARVIELAISTDADLDVERWADAAELTASRVGLLLSGDLFSAARALRDESSPLCAPARTSATERRDDLLRYGLSESYFLVRSWLGIDATL